MRYSKGKRVKPGICSVTKKREYATTEAAELFAKRFVDKTEVYQCDHCGWFHLTKMPKRYWKKKK